ncbi:NAD(P)/FAD-dependent oxidoreductase [Burkholderia sp. MR1-5-21]
MSKRVAVIGAGIVGSCIALELVEQGYRVTLVEPNEAGGPHAASYGNGTWISPGSIIPMSTPGLWKQIPTLLADPQSPLVVRWKDLPGNARWLLQFFLAGATRERLTATVEALANLLVDAPERYRALASRIGLPNLIRSEGLTYVYPEKSAFEAEAFFWELRRKYGITWSELDYSALHAREPDLADRYRFAILVEDGAQCIDPGRFVAGIVEAAIILGLEYQSAEASGFEIEAGKLHAVKTNRGSIPCDYAVISAGIKSKQLALSVGDGISMISERGYHAVIKNPAVYPRYPILPTDGKMANTLTPGGLRLAGQVEIASIETPPDWKRVDLLVEHALRTFPGLGDRDHLEVERWMGHRPSTSDGLPVIGRARHSSQIIHAFGHGHVGLTAAPKTAKIVADLIAGRQPEISIDAYTPRRF